MAWLLVSVLAGLWLSNVRWGDPDGFHGIGLPVAGVLWDHHPDGGRRVDFPNPYAYVLNPLLIFLSGVPFILLIRKLSRKNARITDH